MALIAAVIFGSCFSIYTLLLGGLFGFSYLLESQTIVPVFNAGVLLLGLGLSAYHSAYNQGIVVSWLRGVAFLFAFSLHTEFAGFRTVTVITIARTLWETATFGVPLGTIGFLVGTLVQYIREPELRSQYPLRYVAGMTVFGPIFGGSLFVGCSFVFGESCFAATLA